MDIYYSIYDTNCFSQPIEAQKEHSLDLTISAVTYMSVLLECAVAFIVVNDTIVI